jgi:hypothetical protein
LRARVTDYGVGSSLLPSGFEAYVQVLHPAFGPGDSRLRWRDIADRAGLPLLPGVWFQDFQELAPKDDQPWVQEPAVGQIPDDVLDVLTPTLAGHTASGHGWFGLWDGWGFLHGSIGLLFASSVDSPPPPGAPTDYRARPAFSAEVLQGPKLTLPDRAYLLFQGPLDAAKELGAWVDWEPAGRSYERQTPSLWWPEDRAWCAGNEIDASWTCIGGTRQLIDELLAHSGLETLELDPDIKLPPYVDRYPDAG